MVLSVDLADAVSKTWITDRFDLYSFAHPKRITGFGYRKQICSAKWSVTRIGGSLPINRKERGKSSLKTDSHCGPVDHPVLPWFALRVKAKHEKRVHEFLQCGGQEAFLPLLQERHRWTQRWQDIEVPLFPGYVFCRFSRSAWGRVINTPGVIDAVRFGQTLAQIDESEIESLRVAQAAACAMLPAPYVSAGRWIEVQAGPLAGARGRVITDVGADELILSVELLQRSVRVKIAREWIVEAPALGAVITPAAAPANGR